MHQPPGFCSCKILIINKFWFPVAWVSFQVIIGNIGVAGFILPEIKGDSFANNKITLMLPCTQTMNIGVYESAKLRQKSCLVTWISSHKIPFVIGQPITSTTFTAISLTVYGKIEDKWKQKFSY